MSEAVDHPSHYQSKSGLEAIDVIEAFNLDFHLGNAVKYILRAGKKDNELQDLEKAMWYLARHITFLDVDYGKKREEEDEKAAECMRNLVKTMTQAKKGKRS